MTAFAQRPQHPDMPERTPSVLRPGQPMTDQHPSIMYPAAFSKIEFTDEATHQVCATTAWKTEYVLHGLDSNVSGVNYRNDMRTKKVELYIARAENDIVLTFKAAGREVIEIRVNANEFMRRSIVAPTENGREKHSDAALYLQSRTRTSGIEFSATTANKIAQALHCRYG